MFYVLGLSLALATQAPPNYVVFNNGVIYDGKVPASYQPLVEAVRAEHAKATFTVQADKLLVGLQVDGKKGELLTFRCQSDCPVNSQFSTQEAPPILVKLVKPLLVAWTKLRHPGFDECTVKNFKHTPTWAEVVLNEPVKRVARK